ncbi:MAG: hypothetical protein Q8P59_07355 [Dehalococcoidia bacterium]|nr:hypothetical protein [Dehalococcoidia bacterium]
MTPEQKELFVEIALAGVTTGFYHVHEWLAVYEETVTWDFVPDPEVREKILREASEAMASFLNEAGPSERPFTSEDAWEMCAAHFRSCCFPGCYREGTLAVPGRENTNLVLCEKHDGCVRAPARRVK